MPFAAPFFLFAAFILLLLVSLSLPIIKAIYLFKLSVNLGSGVLSSPTASGYVKFGVWGYCVSAVNVAVAGIQRSVTAARCSPKKLGYSFDQSIANALHVNGFTNVISRGLTVVLILHPIACLLTFIAFVTSLFMLCRGRNGTSRLPSACTLGIASLALIVTTIVFVVDIVLVLIVRRRVNDQSADLAFSWGNAVWMVLGALVAIVLANFDACAGIFAFGSRRRARKATY